MAVEENTRLLYLDAMGIQAWQLRLQASGLGEGVGSIALQALPALPVAELGQAIPVDRDSIPSTTQPPPAAAPSHASAMKTQSPLSSCNWEELQAQVASCTACPLHQTRTQTVFGTGDRSADWMVIGEAPGEQEDLQGEPFVGRAGLLLNEMLRSIGLDRERVFIANILKCRPPKNRDPQVDEASACEGYLKEQLALVKPRIILAVGRVAAQNLLKTTTTIGKLRGIVHDYQSVPLVVTYHPAYLLRSPLEKRRAFDDLRLALHTYRKTL